MDPLLRGLCEQQIDKKLSGSNIQDIKNLVEILHLPVMSKEDAALGMFLGSIYNQLGTQCMKMYDRLPEMDEIHDYHLILKRRVREIKAKIAQLEESNKLEAIADDDVEPEKDTEDYALIIQKKTQELKNKKEAKSKGKKPDSSKTIEESNKIQSQAVKFSFNSSSRKESKRNLLGIPIKKKEKVLVAKT